MLISCSQKQKQVRHPQKQVLLQDLQVQKHKLPQIFYYQIDFPTSLQI
jgi:hypothetical protein